MQTLLHERSGALRIPLTDRGHDDAIEIPAFHVDPGLRPWELRPNAPVESATLEESTQSGMPAVTGSDGGEEKTPAPETPKAPHLSKAEFILGLPNDLSVSEVVARAKERGLTISEPYVYQVRYDAMAAPEPTSVATPVTAQADEESESADSQGGAAAPEAPKPTPPNKSEFIRGLPMDLSPKEVVARAREQGITIDRGYVKGIRAAARARALRGAPAAPAAPATPATAKPAPMSATQSKSDFIRSLPSSVSYAEAATKAKAVGILLSSSHFYAVMGQAKKDASGAPKSKAVRKPIKQPASAPALEGLRLASDDAHEQTLIDVVRALGLSRSRAVIDLIEKVERVAKAAH